MFHASFRVIVRAGFGSSAQKVDGLRLKEPNTMNL